MVLITNNLMVTFTICTVNDIPWKGSYFVKLDKLLDKIKYDSWQAIGFHDVRKQTSSKYMYMQY